MVDMGIEPFNVANAGNLITAQRLVRRICSSCKEPAQYPDEYLRAGGISDDDIRSTTFYRGKGCEQCGGSGYQGRPGWYEVMAMSPTLRRMILQNASTVELQAQALAEGMRTLRRDGMLKVRKGITTLEEVIKETAAG